MSSNLKEKEFLEFIWSKSDSIFEGDGMLMGVWKWLEEYTNK